MGMCCAGNPVKLVDVDGKAPWNNPNIRAAKRYRDRLNNQGISCQYHEWRDSEGRKCASVTYSEVVTDYKNVSVATSHCQRFMADKNNQHNAVYNILAAGDEALEGHYDSNIHGLSSRHEVATELRAVANLAEGVSDVCDGAAVASAVSVVGAELVPCLATVGKGAGYASDAISAVADVVEGKLAAGGIQILGTAVGAVVGHFAIDKLEGKFVHPIVSVGADKVLDASVNAIKQEVNENNSSK